MILLTEIALVSLSTRLQVSSGRLLRKAVPAIPLNPETPFLMLLHLHLCSAVSYMTYNYECYLQSYLKVDFQLCVTTPHSKSLLTANAVA